MFLCLISVVLLKAEAATPQKKILIMVSEGFNAIEYYVPLKAFETEGFKVVTATKYLTPTTPDRRQVDQYPVVNGDITFDKIKTGDFDAIVFAGGNGAWEDFFPNPDVHQALINFMKDDKIVALLCSSTGLLGVANNLNGEGAPIAKGRRVTGYEKVEGLLKKMGQVEYTSGDKTKPYVVIDGKLITGRDPLSSALFASKVIESLK